MRKQKLKQIICCMGAGCMLTTAQAQQVEVKQERPFAVREIFIGGSLGQNWLFYHPTNSFNMVGKLSVGTNFNQWSGIRGVVNGGWKMTDRYETRRYFMGGAEYLFNFTRLFKKDYNQEQRFKMYVHVGVGANFLYSGETGNYIDQMCPSGNIGFSATYDVMSRVAVTAEWNNYLMKGQGHISKSWMPGIDLSIGLKFYPFDRTIQNVNRDVLEIRKQMQENRIRQEQMQESIEQMQKELKETREFLNNRNLSLTSDSLSYVDIRFNEYSSQFASRQDEKLARIASWLNENKDFSIQVIPFSDDRENRAELEKKRGEAVVKSLTSDYGVAASRIQVKTPEEMGFLNVNDNVVKIVYIQKK